MRMVPDVTSCSIVPNWLGKKSMDHCRSVLRCLPGDKLLELFGGSGRVVIHSLAKQRWWNDADKRLHALAVAIRDTPEELLERCSLMPLEQDAADALWEDMKPRRMELKPEELAWATAFTYGGRMTSRVHVDHQPSQYTWSSWLSNVGETSKLLQDVRLSCYNWCHVIRNEVERDWDVYADPPYYKVGNNYMSDRFESLLLFHELERMVAVVSEYDCPVGWYVKDDMPARRMVNKHYNFLSPQLGEMMS